MLAFLKVVAAPGLFILILLSGCARRDDSLQYRYPRPGMFVQWHNDDWATVLSQVVTDDGHVKYDLFIENVDGVRDALRRHVGRINGSSPANRPELFASETDKLAYYLNSYNALCMYAVVERGLPDNVWLAGILRSEYFSMGGRRISLDELENRIIRPFGDPRIHFALNWMSNSCPPLRPDPYEGSKLDEQLEDQGLRYLSDPRAVQAIDADTVRLTELIASFYPQDFIAAYERQSGVTPVNVLEAIAPHAAPDSPVQTAKDYERLPFDWTLNRAK